MGYTYRRASDGGTLSKTYSVSEEALYAAAALRQAMKAHEAKARETWTGPAHFAAVNANLGHVRRWVNCFLETWTGAKRYGLAFVRNHHVVDILEDLARRDEGTC